MNWKLLHFFAYTFCRYFIATMLISYALAKILGTQFTIQPSVYDKSIDTLTGFELTWFFYGYSRWYSVVLSILQISCSLLLFFQRTTRLGILLFLTIISNIVLIDFAYDIQGAKSMALLLTAMGLFIFFSEYRLYFHFLLQVPPRFNKLQKPTWIIRYKWLKRLYIPIVFIGFFSTLSFLKAKYMGRTPFYGTWQAIEINTAIPRLHFEAAQTFKISRITNNEVIIAGEYKFTKDSIFLYCSKEDITNSDLPSTTDKSEEKEFQDILKGTFQIEGSKLNLNMDDTMYQFEKVR